MAKNLVIVESPSKSKTIEKYLGKDYSVTSSKGHIRDLATTGKYGFGVDIEDNFKPNYIPIKGKKKTITELKKLADKADRIYLATDPDREGEAISWHLKDSLELTDDKYDRVVFNEITKRAVLDAFLNTRKIDDDLVSSQETRRIIDRIIGFRLSKLMQRKTGGKSAGRVQSVALKLIVDKEREIEAFKEEEYWTIKAIFNDFEAELEKYKNKKIEIKNEIEANEILENLSKAFEIEKVEKTTKSKKARMPFTTSTLQQEASSKLGFSPRKTMIVAQSLYEGKELEDETVGLITYMRTDSTRLSNDFISDTFSHIEGTMGKQYLGLVRKAKTKENVQDAHEGIRPTNIKNNPEKIKSYLSPDEFKLYSLIYARALASLMSDAKFDAVRVDFDNNDYKFKATGSTLTFDGYLKVYGDYEKQEDKILPSFDKFKTDTILSKEIQKEQHFTKPPARYTEAKLIKEMEELGIGRPSTYAPTMETIKARNYVILEDKKFRPTEQGVLITDKLQEFFQSIINVKYTKEMEEDLDEIAEGQKQSVPVLSHFYNEFSELVEKADEGMEKIQPEETGENCPNCGSPLVIRNGRYGKFVACSNFPECKYIENKEDESKIITDCPNCDGKITEKRTKKGKIFYGCNNYPKCKTAYWDKPTGDKCPECNSMLLEKGKKIKCSECEYEKDSN